jgi:hypothetical protein
MNALAACAPPPRTHLDTYLASRATPAARGASNGAGPLRRANGPSKRAASRSRRRRFAACARLVALSLSLVATAQGAPKGRGGRAAKRPTAAASAEAEACVPDCRSGFACIEGQCLSKCNPLCGEGERCTDAGECEPTPTSSVSGPLTSAGQRAPSRRTTRTTSSGRADREAAGDRAPAATEIDASEDPWSARDAGPPAPSAPPPEPSAGVRRHDGFFLRLSVGPSLFHASYTAGIGGNYELALGGTAGRGVVVGGMVSPKVLLVTESGVPIPLFASFLGPFVDLYPDPSNGLHVLGAIGVGSASYNGHLAPALEAMVGLGKEWWVGEQWSIGVLGRLSASTARVTYSSSAATDGDRSSITVLSGLVTFTYH